MLHPVTKSWFARNSAHASVHVFGEGALDALLGATALAVIKFDENSIKSSYSSTRAMPKKHSKDNFNKKKKVTKKLTQDDFGLGLCPRSALGLLHLLKPQHDMTAANGLR